MTLMNFSALTTASATSLLLFGVIALSSCSQQDTAPLHDSGATDDLESQIESFVRKFPHPALSNSSRISAGTPEQTDRLIDALRIVV